MASELATTLGALIDADPLYEVAILANVITVAAATAGVPFTFTDTTIDAGTSDLAATVNNTATQVNIVGTGMQTMRITYLDALGLRASEVLTLAGTGGALTTATDIGAILSCVGESFGSGGAAAGTIDIGDSVGSVSYDVIAAGFCESAAAAYTVPTRERAWVETHATMTVAGVARIMSDCNPVTGLVVSGTKYVWHSTIVRFAPGNEHMLGPFPAGATIWATATQAASARATVYFDGYLEPVV